MKDLDHDIVAKDGITHINVYSKGRTGLGKFLSNLARIPIDTEDGRFATIEGYWYWLGTNAPDREYLRSCDGLSAKNNGRRMRSNFPVNIDAAEFQRKISKAIKTKIRSRKLRYHELIRNKLPLVHYYVYNGTIIDKTEEASWVLQAILDAI